MDKTKPYEISKTVVLEAYKRVKANKGAAGIDDESIAEFEENLKDNLYKIWNRMSSGSYFPPPVKAVEIPKKNGGIRVLGVPTVSTNYTEAQLPFGKYNHCSPIPPFMWAKLCDPQSEGGKRDAQIFSTNGYRCCLCSRILDRPTNTNEYGSRPSNASF